MRVWLTFALLSLVAGCAGDHTPQVQSDAGMLPVDAAACMGSPETRDGTISDLTCPISVAPGQPIVVEITSNVGACCPETAALEPVVTQSGASAEVRAPYSLCDCCLLCRCIGTSTTRSVTVLAAAAGTTFHVVAGDRSCDVAIEPLPMCRPVPLSGVHVPTASPMGQPIPVHLVSEEASSSACGCDVRTDVGPAGGPSLSACDCCDACDCIDFGYEATAFRPAPTVMPDTVVTLGTSPEASTTLVDPARCVASTAQVIGIDALAPDARLRQGEPRGTWVMLRAMEGRCCGEPLELVTHGDTSDGSIELFLAECHPDPCDCGSDEPHDASTPVYLGVLASGPHVVRARGVSTTIMVP